MPVASAAASSSVAPPSITLAPCLRVFSIFTVGVRPALRSLPEWRAGRVIGDTLRVIAGRHGDHAAAPFSAESADSRLSAPRSLKVAVNCRFSNFSQISAPVMSDSVRLRSQLVRFTKPSSTPAAVSMSRA